MALLFFLFLWLKGSAPYRGALFDKMLFHEKVELLILDMVPLDLVGQFLQEPLLRFADLLHLQVHDLVFMVASSICVHDSPLLIDVRVLKEVLIRDHGSLGTKLRDRRALDDRAVWRTLAAPQLSQGRL